MNEATSAKATHTLQGYFLYRWYDAKGTLLYVGISTDPVGRQKSHEHASWWSHWGVRFVVEDSPCGMDRPTAELAEANTIKTESPIFNRSGADHARDRVVRYLESRGLDPAEFSKRIPGNRGSREGLALDALRTEAQRKREQDARFDAAVIEAAKHHALRIVAAASGLNHQTVANRVKQSRA